jgi:phenol 2-monooxygenase (NADPH)
MQFHLNGFKTGDPDATAASPAAMIAGGPLPDEVDVLIVGAGPAGLTLAAQLSAFPSIKVRVVEQKSGPLQLGQADGVACRTLEMFEAFGFAERVMKESCWINEVSFWKPDAVARDHIVRQGRIQDVEDGLSEFPHVILNQARVHDFYLDIMQRSPNRLVPDYGRRLLGLTVDRGGASHPVTVKLERSTADGAPATTETVRARYVVGCDGARSAVRQSLGYALEGDSANQAWGVMDVLAVTTFPDIRMKALIQSASEGSIVLIPREGGYLVRIYVELDKLSADERVASRNLTIDRLIAAAQRIFRPYTFDVKEVAWWSVYEIGQRLCPSFDDVPAAERGVRNPHVFIAGDACHTHSPKAGQGMNVSMQDTFNLGWKLASVLRGRAKPDLLQTYSAERHAIAKELIDFDREWARMLSAPLKTTPDGNGVDPVDVQSYFVRHGRYTAGTATRYKPALLTGPATHQALAPGFEIGTRFHSGPVIRTADAKRVRLGDTLRADGRWRLIAFADRVAPTVSTSRLAALCAFLTDDARSPLRRYTPAGADIDSVIDLRAVVQQGHRDVDPTSLPKLLLPAKGRHGLLDYEKLFSADLKDGPDVFDLRQVNRDQGCLVVVRPDQYVAHLLPLDGTADLANFFAQFMIPQT